MEALHSLRVFLRARAIRESLSSSVALYIAGTLSNTLGEQPAKKGKRKKRGKKQSFLVHDEVGTWGKDKSTGSRRLVWVARFDHVMALLKEDILPSLMHDGALRHITGDGRMHRMKRLYPEIEGLCSFASADPTDAGDENEAAPSQEWQRRTTPMGPGERVVALFFGDLHEEDFAYSATAFVVHQMLMEAQKQLFPPQLPSMRG